MRPIKFRAWDKENKCMVHVEAIQFNANGEVIELTTNDRQDYLIKYFDLMQSTGLTDRHGKEIWEGDVVQYDYRPGAPGIGQQWTAQVVNEGLGFEVRPIGGGYYGHFFAIPGAYEPNCRKLFEVLGNIYEHPELLKKK